MGSAIIRKPPKKERKKETLWSSTVRNIRHVPYYTFKTILIIGEVHPHNKHKSCTVFGEEVFTATALLLVELPWTMMCLWWYIQYSYGSVSTSTILRI